MLKLTITGAPGEGKTTLAVTVAEALKALGFAVQETDEDVLNDAVPANSLPQLQAAVASKGPVEVATAQVSKDGAVAGLRLYTFGWSSRSSAGTMAVVETSREAAWSVALSYHGRDELSFESEEACVAGAHHLVTTEQRPI